MIDAKRLGLAGGILWGAVMFIMTIIAQLTHYGEAWLLLLESVYVGYHISFFGSIVGAIYGFIDGFIGLFLLGWIYNKLGKI